MSEIRKCPKCGEKLEEGVMQVSAVVFWDKNNFEEHWTAQSVLGGKIMLESSTWRCKNCQLAIFSYNRQNLKW